MHQPVSVEEKLDVTYASQRRESAWTWVGIVFTALATGMVFVGFGQSVGRAVGERAWFSVATYAMFGLLVAGLIYGGFVYLLARLAFLRRLRAHLRSRAPDTGWLFDGQGPSLSILVPSYKEERRIVEMTLLSAALQDYPSRRVVLLLDDPPRPASAEDAARLEAMRRLPSDVGARLRPMHARMERERRGFVQRRDGAQLDVELECRRLARLYLGAAWWFQRRADTWAVEDHADATFVGKVLLRQRDALLNASVRASEAARATSVDGSGACHVQRGYDHLVGLFDVHLTSFERKRFANLSHEPNKAMNLNAYLGLMGKRFDVKSVGDETLLVETPDGTTEVPWADYVITLDADSVLLTDYAARLVDVMERPGGERIAVAQTPYSAFPGAQTDLERIAGATTDMQYVIHQGFAGHDATYWVGANAVLRRTALDDIAVRETERGHPVTRYIQDRTVIEDTESTIDLVVAGWTLHNHPERLAYSATPPDFGSLSVQRARWANGGLLILPKLLRYLLRQTPGRPTVIEGFMRLHYLISIATVNSALLILLAVPVSDAVASPWLPLTALPYYALYTRDLVLLGYRWTDVFRVYALNVLLIPVNLHGVLTSLRQAILKTKIPFSRTPKVSGRTATPAGLLLVVMALIVHWSIGAGFDAAGQRWLHAGFASAHAAVLTYALATFVGLRHALVDVRLAWRSRRTARPIAVRPTAFVTSATGVSREPSLDVTSDVAVERATKLA